MIGLRVSACVSESMAFSLLLTEDLRFFLVTGFWVPLNLVWIVLLRCELVGVGDERDWASLELV